MKGKIAVIGCPKLDDAGSYREKLANIIQANDIEFIHVVYMEVPCCGGLVRLVQNAIEEARVPVSLTLAKVGIQGETLERETVRYRFS